jgi:hypothetical protein
MGPNSVRCQQGVLALLPAAPARGSAPWSRSAHSHAALRRLDARAFRGAALAGSAQSRRRCRASASQKTAALMDVDEGTFEAEVLQVGA